MNKYSEIEIETAKRLLGKGYTWVKRTRYGNLYAYKYDPIMDDSMCVFILCANYFESIKFGDEPTNINDIVYPQILDDAERKYLSAVIKPFRDMVMYLTKSDEIIVISFKYKSGDNQWSNDVAHLPYFGTMYKGMKKGHDYTLEELGL